MSRKLQSYLYAVVLAITNLAIAWRMFRSEFTPHTSSNEGSFIAISRYLVEHRFHFGWFPYWFNGLPFENAYSPFLQIVDALLAMGAHRSTAWAFHFVIGLFYAAGPLLLYWFASRVSRLPATSFWAAMIYSLTSPSTIFPAVRGDLGGWLSARRLHTLVHYGEGSHNVALSLLPLSLLLAYLAYTRRRFHWWLATGALMGVMVLTNAFAAVDLAIALTCLALSQPAGERWRALWKTTICGITAYLVICPFLTPTLIQTIRHNSVLGGGYQYRPQEYAALLFLLLGTGILSRFSHDFHRLCALLAFLFFTIPALAYFLGIHVLPQPERYHLEMEMAVCLAVVFAAHHLVSRLDPVPRAALVGVLGGLLIAQFIVYRNYARQLIYPIDITTTTQYKTARWLDRNLPGAKAMVSGDVGTWFNVFTDNPQLSSGHDPFSPNWMVEIATYQIYSGEGAQGNEAAQSILWLKAFGCDAVTVPGPGSREAYHPYRNPDKFEGVLPLLHRDGPDSIYAVPRRSRSFAHIVPESAWVHHPPSNGIDLAEVERFVDATEDPSFPEARLHFTNDDHAQISAALKPGQAIQLQMTYDPGWTSSTPISKDGLGLIVLHPTCTGACTIDLAFTGGLERRAARIISLLTILFVILKLWHSSTSANGTLSAKRKAGGTVSNSPTAVA